MAWTCGNRYELLGDDGAVMFVRTDVRLMLQENGLARFEDFMTLARGEVINAHGRLREVVSLELRAGGAVRPAFLKRSGPSHLKDALKDLLLLRRVRTKAMTEFEMLFAFRKAGLSVPEPLAAGDRHVLGCDRGSFILVEAFPSGRPLDVALTEPEDETVRLRLVRSIAQFVRRMHDSGLSHGELFTKHIFVEEKPDGSWSLSVIDLQGAAQAKTVSPRRRARDLAALLVSLPPEETTLHERVAFLREYLNKPRLGREDFRFVRNLVVPCARKLTRRDACKAWRAVLQEIRP